MDGAIGGRGIGGNRSSMYRRRAMQVGHWPRCANTASIRVRRAFPLSMVVPSPVCSAWRSAHSGSPLAANAASRSSIPARHVSHCTTRCAGLMRPRSHATTTAGVRLSSAAIESGVSPRRRRVAISSSGVTTEAWPPRHNPASRQNPAQNICLLRADWTRAYGAGGARDGPHTTRFCRPALDVGRPRQRQTRRKPGAQSLGG